MLLKNFREKSGSFSSPHSLLPTISLLLRERRHQSYASVCTKLCKCIHRRAAFVSSLDFPKMVSCQTLFCHCFFSLNYVSWR